MELMNILIELVGSYSALLSYISGLLTEEFLIFLAILSGANVLPIWIIFVFGFLGIMTHDILFYFIGRSKLAYYIKKRFQIAKRHKKIELFIEKTGRKSIFLQLLFSKFIYGIRIAIVIYVSHKEPKFRKYLVYNSLAVLIWLIIMLPLGWLAGQGFTQLLHVAKGIEKFLAIFLFSLLILYIFRKLIVSFVKKGAN